MGGTKKEYVGMMIKHYLWGIIFVLALALPTASIPAAEFRELGRYSMDTLDDLITQTGVKLDESITSDGGGSIKIVSGAPQVIQLFETGDIDAENVRLEYQARLRTKDMRGSVYLEMWCRFPEKGEFFSRSLHKQLHGSTDWTPVETVFFLRPGENPDNVRLNLVVNGVGTVWIDDVVLVTFPLNQ